MQLEIAIAILRQLAEGIDPQTGASLPIGSVLQYPETIRALYTVIREIETRSGAELPLVQLSIATDVISNTPNTIGGPARTTAPVGGDFYRSVSNRITSKGNQRDDAFSRSDRSVVRFMREGGWRTTKILKPGHQCCYCFEEIENGVVHFTKEGISPCDTGTGPDDTTVRIRCCQSCAAMQFDGEFGETFADDDLRDVDSPDE